MRESPSAPPGAAPEFGQQTGEGLRKAPTGIRGFDAICLGGLPHGRPTLVTGAAGAGKTLFAAEFLLRGILEFGEPGVLLAFEESADDLAANMASLGFDLPALVAAGLLFLPETFQTTGDTVYQTGAAKNQIQGTTTIGGG